MSNDSPIPSNDSRLKIIVRKPLFALSILPIIAIIGSVIMRDQFDNTSAMLLIIIVSIPFMFFIIDRRIPDDKDNNNGLPKEKSV